MIIMVNSLEWPFLFRFREVESSGKLLKQNQLGEEDNHLYHLYYCLSFKCCCKDGFYTHGTENFILPVSDILHFYDFFQDHGIILELQRSVYVILVFPPLRDQNTFKYQILRSAFLRGFILYFWFGS